MKSIMFLVSLIATTTECVPPIDTGTREERAGNVYFPGHDHSEAAVAAAAKEIRQIDPIIIDQEMHIVENNKESFCPHEALFCEEPMAYPSHLVDALLTRIEEETRNLNHVHFMATNDVLDNEQIVQSRINYYNRHNFDYNDDLYTRRRGNDNFEFEAKREASDSGSDEYQNNYDKNEKYDDKIDKTGYDKTNGNDNLKNESKDKSNEGTTASTKSHSNKNLKEPLLKSNDKASKEKEGITTKELKRPTPRTSTSTTSSSSPSLSSNPSSSSPSPSLPPPAPTPFYPRVSAHISAASTSSDPDESMFIQETPLCHTISSFVYPRRAQNRDHVYRFIVNAPHRAYVQAVKIEKCLTPGQACVLNGGLTFEDLHIKTVCRQKYTYRRMLAINEEGREEVDLFKFPSCCVCNQIEETPFGMGGSPLRTGSVQHGFTELLDEKE